MRVSNNNDLPIRNIDKEVLPSASTRHIHSPKSHHRSFDQIAIQTSSANINLKTKKACIPSASNWIVDILEKIKAAIANIFSKPEQNHKEIEKAYLKQNFLSVYQNKMKDFDHLSLENDQLNDKLDAYLALSETFELNPNFEEFFSKISLINRKIQSKKFKGDAHLIKDIVNDLLIFSIVPVKISKTRSNFIQRQSIEIVSPFLLDEILTSLSRSSKISSNPYLSHIQTDYASQSLHAKMLSINLSNVKKQEKTNLTNDPFYQEFMKLAQSQNSLDKWMFACSGALEQNYLNTCLGASSCQEITSKVILLPQAIFLVEKTLEDLEIKFQKKKTTMNPIFIGYIEKRIQMHKESFTNLKKDILDKMKTTEVSEEEMSAFTVKWSKETEKVGLLVDLDDTGHPTKKLISNHWFLSVLLMLPVVLFEHLIGKSENPPNIKMRANGGFYPLPKGLLDSTNAFHPAIEKKDVSANLWKMVNSKGGGSYCNSNNTHAFYMKAIVYKGKKVFLIGDPKQKDYQIFSFRDFVNSSYAK